MEEFIGGYPASLRAECTVIGGILVEPTAIYAATEHLISTDFALDSHRRIYGAILTLIEEQSAVDIVTVAEELKRTKQLDTIGGVAYLASLSEGLPRKLSFDSYAKIIKDKSSMRQGMIATERALVDMGDGEHPPQEIFSRLQMDMLDLIGDANTAKIEKVSQITGRVVEKIKKEREMDSRADAFGLTYGVPEIDRLTKGAYPNEYTVIAADTGGAKTAWAIQITIDNALKGVPVLWFSMEMTKEQLLRRMLSCLSKVVTAKDIRDPRFMNILALHDLEKTAELLNTLPIYIDDTRQLPIDMAVARGKAAIYRDGVKLIIGDYLQLFGQPSGAKKMNDVERIDYSTLALRDLAAESKEYGVHVIALSQYSRPSDAGGRGAKNSRVKGSSSIEQSCQVLMHLVREELEGGVMSEDIEIVIGKSREGKRGTIRCKFNEDHLRLYGTS